MNYYSVIFKTCKISFVTFYVRGCCLVLKCFIGLRFLLTGPWTTFGNVCIKSSWNVIFTAYLFFWLMAINSWWKIYFALKFVNNVFHECKFHLEKYFQTSIIHIVIIIIFIFWQICLSKFAYILCSVISSDWVKWNVKKNKKQYV